ncbi:MAG: hypothetical protein ACYDCK_04175 [Thermoplasmatota archaeon]
MTAHGVAAQGEGPVNVIVSGTICGGGVVGVGFVGVVGEVEGVELGVELDVGVDVGLELVVGVEDVGVGVVFVLFVQPARLTVSERRATASTIPVFRIRTTWPSHHEGHIKGF